MNGPVFLLTVNRAITDCSAELDVVNENDQLNAAIKKVRWNA
jgi:hypothetical protein